MTWRRSAVRIILTAGLLSGISGALGCTIHPPLITARHVDLSRYAGTWYEIARFPERFQRDCVATQAQYTPLDDGTIKVVNQCRTRSFDGELQNIEGTAHVVEPSTNARLKVKFGFLARGDYWIIEVDQEYRYALVGTPDRKHLWILSRTPVMSDEVYRALRSRAADQGFPVERLLTTPQPA
jgi:apolipoprotein D and lipocalin family protein